MPKKSISYLAGVFILVIGIFLGWGIVKGVHYTESPAFCGLCHIMDPFTKSWEQGPHTNTSRCYDCHADPGLVGFVKAKYRGAKELYSYLFTDVTSEDIELESIPTRRCKNCHEDAHSEDEFSDRIFPDIRETGDSQPCQQCHTEMGHLGLTEEETEAYEPKYASWNYSEFMDNYHHENKVTCAACHGSSYPEEKASIENCEECHGGYDVQSELTSDVQPNPHDSHLGEIRCTACHKSHQESSLVCNQCHEFELQTPQEMNFGNK